MYIEECIELDLHASLFKQEAMLVFKVHLDFTRLFPLLCPINPTNTTDSHEIAELLSKVGSNVIKTNHKHTASG
jgi:hypothetical protein